MDQTGARAEPEGPFVWSPTLARAFDGCGGGGGLITGLFGGGADLPADQQVSDLVAEIASRMPRSPRWTRSRTRTPATPRNRPQRRWRRPGNVRDSRTWLEASVSIADTGRRNFPDRRHFRQAHQAGRGPGACETGRCLDLCPCPARVRPLRGGSVPRLHHSGTRCQCARERSRTGRRPHHGAP